MKPQLLRENYSLGTVSVFSTQLLLITSMSEPLLPCYETDVWVKIFHKLKLHRAAYCGRGLGLFVLGFSCF